MLARLFWSQPFRPNLLASTAPWCPDNVATTFWSSQINFTAAKYGQLNFCEKKDSPTFYSTIWFIWVTWHVSEPEFHSIQEPELSKTSDMHLLFLYPTCFRFVAPWYPRPLRHGPGAMSKSKVMEVWMNRFLVDEVDTPWRKGSSYQPRKPDSNTRSSIILNNTGGGLSPVWSSFHQKDSPSNSNVSFHKQPG